MCRRSTAYGGMPVRCWLTHFTGPSSAARSRSLSFRAIRRQLLTTILSYDLNFTFVDGLLAWNTQRIGQVEVEHLSRRSGRSGYDLKKLVLLALNLFTNFSLLPLQIVSGCGFVVSAFGFLLAFYYLDPGAAFQYRRTGLCLDHHGRVDHRRNPTSGAWHHGRISRSSPFECESESLSIGCERRSVRHSHDSDAESEPREPAHASYLAGPALQWTTCLESE